MRNPLESEDAAFRFVLGTIAYLVPIVLASWIATWLGIVVFVLVSGVALVLLRRRTGPLPAPPPTGRASVEDTPATQASPARADGGSGDGTHEGPCETTDDVP